MAIAFLQNKLLLIPCQKLVYLYIQGKQRSQVDWWSKWPGANPFVLFKICCCALLRTAQWTGKIPPSCLEHILRILQSVFFCHNHIHVFVKVQFILSNPWWSAKSSAANLPSPSRSFNVLKRRVPYSSKANAFGNSATGFFWPVFRLTALLVPKTLRTLALVPLHHC